MVEKAALDQVADILEAHIPEEELQVVAAKLRTVTGERRAREMANGLADRLCPEAKAQSGGFRLPDCGRMKRATKGEG